jgi:hypothetical protein
VVLVGLNVMGSVFKMFVEVLVNCSVVEVVVGCSVVEVVVGCSVVEVVVGCSVVEVVVGCSVVVVGFTVIGLVFMKSVEVVGLGSIVIGSVFIGPVFSGGETDVVVGKSVGVGKGVISLGGGGSSHCQLQTQTCE